MTTMRCPYCGCTESVPATDGATAMCAECDVEMESRDETVNSDVARELLASLHPSAERELAKREPDWSDLCSYMGGATLFVAAPALARAVITLTASCAAAAADFDRLVARVWRAATGDAHEGPASVEVLLAAVEGLRANNDRLTRRIGSAKRDAADEALDEYSTQVWRALGDDDDGDAFQALRAVEEMRAELDATREALRAHLRCDECGELATRVHAETASFCCDAHATGDGWDDTTHAAAVRAAMEGRR